jgi:outer membrane lipoprotein-sorting protein
MLCRGLPDHGKCAVRYTKCIQCYYSKTGRMYFHLRKTTLLLLVSLLTASGCGIRSSHPVKMLTSTATLKEATVGQLEDNINTNAANLKTLKATVDIDSWELQPQKNRIKDNPQVSGLILVRKPEMLRMRIYVPLLHNVMADMVSDGKNFKLASPIKSKFYIGSNRQPVKPSAQPLEDLRPQHISDALLLKPIEGNEIAFLESTTEVVKDPKTHKDVEQLAYKLVVIDKDKAGYYLSRTIVFSRTDLQPHEQSIYNRQGQVVTYARYENLTDYSGTTFPAIISIQRPIEGYGITISMIKVDVNTPMTDDQFVLTQPAGSQLIDLDTKSSASAVPEVQSKKPPQ